MSDEKDLPSIPSSIDSALRRPLEAMRESIQRLMGMRGADGRAAVRWDDLADEGLASLPRRRLLINQAIEQGATGGGSGGSGGSYVPDLTKPPTPAGLDGVGAITSILLSWTAPAYTVGHGHKQTNVYATKQAVSSSTLYTINDAVRVNTAPGAQTVLAHTSDPNLKWRIWIKFESVDGVESDPAGGVNGFVVSTGQDVTHLLEILTGQIANSQLAAALSTKIALIDAPATTAGSVAAQVKAETDARVAAISQEVADRNTAITAGVNTAKAYTETWAYQKSATDSAIASMGTTIRAEFAAADTTTLNSANAWTTSYTYAKSAIDGSLASLSSTLTANYQAADTATLNSAKSYADASVSSYAYSKAQTDGAIAASTATVSARLNSGGDVYSSISSAQTTASAKNANFKQSATPTATKAGDTWIDTANGNLLKVWSGSAWVASDDTRIGTAASSISTLQSQIAGSSGSGLLSQIQTEASTRVSETGYIGSLYSVRTQLTAGGKTVIGGFGLMGTSAPGAGTTIDFGVSADKFWVGAPTGSTGVGDIQPFVVQTTDQTVNGVLIPKGVYMDAAYIKNLTAMVSRLGSAWIDNAMVANMSAAKLTVGDGTIGGNLKSTNYVSGTSGWIVRPNGTAEFGFAHIRGTLLASQVSAGFITASMITSNGLDIRDASGNIVIKAGSAVDWSRLGGASTNLTGLGYTGDLDATKGAPTGTSVGGSPAETVAVKALAALQKTGDTITGRINMSVADGLFAGTDTNNGIYLGSSGLVGKKAGVTTFAVDTAGNAVFAGEIAAGSIDVEKLSGTSTSYATPGTYSFTLPAGFTVMRVTLWAGGGGGGGARSIVGYHDFFPYQACGGGGGQGGRFVATFTGLTPGATYTVVVGAGGVAGQVVLDNSGVYTAPTSAGSGGNSSISGPGISATAYGGAGGSSGYPINAGGTYVCGSGGSGGNGGGAGSNGADGSGYAGSGDAGGVGGGNRGIAFEDWTSTPLEALGIGGNGLRGYGAIYGGPLGHRDPESGRGGFCQIEAYNPNGIVKRSEWDTLITHLNARFTSYTWP